MLHFYYNTWVSLGCYPGTKPYLIRGYTSAGLSTQNTYNIRGNIQVYTHLNDYSSELNITEHRFFIV